MRRKVVLWAALALAAAGCSNEVTGPEPSVSDGPSGAPTDPSFVCNEQVETWVTLSGEDFSPLVIDSINKDAVTSAELQTITLDLVALVEGGETSETMSTTIENDVMNNVKWISSQELRFRIWPELELMAGVYNVTVKNANGSEVTEEAGLGVLPRPVISALVPSFTCLAQGEREFVAEGDFFLVDGDDRPTVDVGGSIITPTAAGDCRDLAPIFGGKQLCKTLTFTLAEAAFEPSVQDVEILNPAPAACRSDKAVDGSELRIVPPPSVTQIVEEVACLDEGERSFVISGADFVGYDGAVPTIHVGDKSYMGTLSGCGAVSVYGGEFDKCTDVSFTVPMTDLAVGVHAVTVENPSPAGCTSSETLELTIVPPPTVTTVVPEVLCSEQLENVITITGTDFLVVDNVAPSVAVGGTDFGSTASNCEAVPSIVNSTVERCTELSVTVPAGTLTAGEQNIDVTNPSPAGCTSTDTVSVAFVPPPSVTTLVEEYTCVETRNATIRVEGTGFIDVGGTLPTVEFGGVDATVTAIENCAAIAGTTTAQTCTALVVEVAEGTVIPGLHEAIVTNPVPAACASTEVVELEVYDAPAVTDVQPGFFCTDAGNTDITVTGTNFFTVDGNNPQILFGGQMIATTVTTATCAATSRANVEVCTELTATVPQANLNTGATAIAVVNPDPIQCETAATTDIHLWGPPTIASLTPGAVCAGSAFDGVVTLTGTSFLRIDGALPSVLVEGNSVAVDSLTGCTAVTHPTLAVETCTTLALTVPAAIRANDVTIDVTNPAPSDCGGSATTQLVHAPTPTIASVTPLRLCDAGGDIQITGTNFDANIDVTLGTTSAATVVVNNDGTSLTATFAAGLTEGVHDVIVTNPNTCTATYGDQVRVVTGPRAFYVDPPVVYNGIATQVTIYLTGLFGGAVTAGNIIDTNGNVIALTNITFDANKPNTLQAVIPANALEMGLTTDIFDVELFDDLNCSESSDDLVTDVDELTVSVSEIDPPFGWTSANTPVSVLSASPAPAGESNFAATPRVYLNPTVPQVGAVATEVRAVEFLSTLELNGIVPTNLPVDTYDVIVINPDGSVGLLAGGYDSTLEPPPLVDAVSPGSWITGETALAFDVEGQDFRSASIDVTCIDPSGGEVTAVANVTAETSTTLSATIDTSNFLQLSVCVIRVTNTADGTYAEFAPISTTNPSGKFVQFQSGTMLRTARRAHSMAGGEASRKARYLYTIGGDAGVRTNPLASVEYASINRLGQPSPWMDMRAQSMLPSPRTESAAVQVGDFIYLVGGYHETATAGVYDVMSDISRARVLEPFDAPTISNVEFDIDPALVGGPTPGVYYYRVAAVMGAADASNPNGETLASERQPVRIPFAGIDLSLTWTPVAGAAEYRIYRSPQADDLAGTEELLATIPAAQTTFVDDGSVATTAGETPLPLGTLGMWHTVENLTVGRANHAVAASVDPADPNTWYIYVAAGETGAGGLLNSVEIVTITVDPTTGHQTLGTMRTAANLSIARTELGMVRGDNQNASYLNASYLYVLGGRDAANFNKIIEVAEVVAGGDIAAWTPTSQDGKTRMAGYATAIANNALVMAGGQNGGPTSTSDKLGVSLADAPDLDSATSLANTSLTPRYQMGYVAFGGFLYITGGDDDDTNTTATRTMDYSILGGTP